MVFINGLSAIGIVIVVALSAFGGLMLWAWIFSSGEKDAKDNTKNSFTSYTRYPQEPTNGDIYAKLSSLERKYDSFRENKKDVYVILYIQNTDEIKREVSKVFSDKDSAIIWIENQCGFEPIDNDENIFILSSERNALIHTEMYEIFACKIEEEN